MNRNNKSGAADRLIRHIQKRYSRLKRKKFYSSFLICIAVLLSGLSFLTWFEQDAYFSSVFKTFVWIGLLGAGIALLIGITRSISGKSFREFYSELAEETKAEPLKYAFDLSLYDRDQNLKLHGAALEKNLASVKWEQLQPEVDRHTRSLPEYRLFKRSIAAVAVSALFLLLSGMVNTDALERSTRFWENFKKPNPYDFAVKPGNATIEQGSSFQPEITFSGDTPGELLLAIKTDVEDTYRFRPMQEEKEGIYRSEPIKLSSNTTYYLRMDEFESDAYQVDVQLRPRFETLAVSVHPPGYTGLDSTRYTYPFSQVKAYQGSDIRISGRTNKPIKKLVMVTDAEEDTLAPETRNTRGFTFERAVAASDTLRFMMSDSSGLTNNNHFEFALDVVQDEYPFIQLSRPESDLKMSTPSPVDITYEASDDFGITSATLHYELQRAFVETPETGSVRMEKPQMNAAQSYTWDITGLNPKPRDVITFWLEVTDNDQYNGYKSSRSGSRTITLPSLVENMEDIQQQESEVQKSLEDISESYEEMRKEYDRFKENLKENPETNWEQTQMLDEVQQKQEEIDKKVEELNKEFENIRKEINQNDMVSEDTRQAYEELKKLMEEINSPELQRALEELQKSLGNLNQQDLRKALENFEFNEELYRERINRTIELFKSLKMNSNLEKIATALEDLARKEEELSKSEASPSDQAEQQEAIQNDTENVSDMVEKLNEDPPEQNKERLEELQKEGEQDLDSIRKELQENIENLNKQQQESGNQQENQNQNNGQNPQSSPQQQQQQIQQQFQQLAQKMRGAKQQMNQQRLQVNMGALQHILYNLITLSEEQEDLTQSTESLANRSQAFVEKARIEKNISQQFSQVSDSLYAVSSQIPGFSNRINEKKKTVQRDLEQAVEQLAERNKSQSTYAERQSLGGINELASMVASLMDQLQNQSQSGMGGGMSMQQFMEQLKNMSGSQQQLNQQIQNLINDIQGDRLTRDQIDRLNQMARQQNQIRKQLRQLQERGGLESGDRLLSELERMAEEMEEAINDLRGGQTDRLLIKRQQNILSRMLNAEKAIQERDKEERREGTAAEDAPQTVPPEVTLEELQKRIRNLLNDPNQTKFSEDYQQLIEQYFELLKQLRENGVSS